MKLHLPVRLRAALLKCLAAVHARMLTLAKTTATASLTLAALAALTPQAQAIGANTLPTGGVVASGTGLGSATISTSGNTTTVVTNGANVAIDWTRFDIGSAAKVQFTQQLASDIALNRVNGGVATTIDGTLSANGRIFIVNTAGILFGSNAAVDAAGLMASTLDISNDDFVAGAAKGEYTFSKSGNQHAEIINKGKITVKDDGFIYLVADRVENAASGELVVGQRGTIGMGAGTKATINLTESGLVSFAVSGDPQDDGEGDAAVENKGKVEAQGGHVVMTTEAARDIASSVIKNDGTVTANSLASLMGGSVTIKASGGSVDNNGTIRADGSNSQQAGTVEIEAKQIANSGTISAKAEVAATMGQSKVTLKATDGAIIDDGLNSIITADSAEFEALSTTAGSIGAETVVEVDGDKYVSIVPVKTAVNNLSIVTDSALKSDGVASGNVSIANSGTGDLNLDIDTIYGSSDAGLSSVVITNANGGINGKVFALSGNFTAAGSIALTDGRFSSFAASVTGTGNISLYNTSDSLMVNQMISRENGETAFNVSNESVHNSGTVMLNQTGDVVIIGTVTAGESVTINSMNGHITSLDAYNGNDVSNYASGTIASNKIKMTAAGSVGGRLNILMSEAGTYSNTGLTITSGTLTDASNNSVGGVYLNGIKGFVIDSITASGTAGTVALNAASGDINMLGVSGNTTISANGVIDLVASTGSVISSGDADGTILDGTSLEIEAYKNIGRDGGGALVTSAAVESMLLLSQSGSIDMERENSASNLTVSAKASSGDISIAQNGTGEMILDQAIAKGAVSLAAGGSLYKLSTSNLTYLITGSSLNLDFGGVIGDNASNPLKTKIDGDLSTPNFDLAANGDINIYNIGDINANIDAGTGDIKLYNSGDMALDELKAAAIVIDKVGDITDANGADVNITADSLVIESADSFGSVSDAIEVLLGDSATAGSITMNVGVGGAYLEQGTTANAYALDILSVKSSGNVAIKGAGDLNLSKITASNKEVSLTAGGDLNAVILTSGDHVAAKSLTISADAVVGDLSTDVDFISTSVEGGDVNITNSGFVYIDAASLQAKAGQNITFTSSGIAVFDNNGGKTTLADDSSLNLVATDGNIVFLNTNDTIELIGTGAFTATATGTSSGATGYVGSVILGNIITAGGDITVNADGHISIAHLNAGMGDVFLTSGGYIIDNNGAANNITANNVEIIAYSKTQSELELEKSFATASSSDLKTLLESYATFLELMKNSNDAAEAAMLYAQSEYESAKLNFEELDKIASDLDASEKALYATFKAASLALDAAEIAQAAVAVAAGAAQAIPLTGDGGTSLAAEIANLVVVSLGTAANAAEIALDTVGFEAGDAADAAGVAEATMNSYENTATLAEMNYDSANANYTQMQGKVNDTTIKLESAAALENMAQAALNNQNAVGTVSQGLGIIATNATITNNSNNDNTGAVTEQGDGNIYLQSDGNLGLGKVEAQGADALVRVEAVGTVTINDAVTAADTITIDSSDGGITGTAGHLTTSDAGSTIKLTAKGDIDVADTALNSERYVQVISEDGAVTLGQVVAKGTDLPDEFNNPGEVKSVIEVEAGTDITLEGELSSEEYVVLNAKNGAITGAANNKITSTNLAAKAATGIKDLNTEIDTIAADGGTGGISVTNTGELTVGTVVLPVTSSVLPNQILNGAVATSGDISLKADSIWIEQQIRTTDDVNLTATVGDVAGTSDDAIGNHVEGDHLTIDSITGVGRTGVELRTAVAELTAHVTGEGNILVKEQDDIKLTDVDTVQGSITITAGGDIDAVDVVSSYDSDDYDIELTSSNGDITVGTITATGAGDVTLSALNGQVINDGDNTTTLTADDLDITAGTGIGVVGADAVTSLNTAVNTLNATTTTGSVHILEADDLLVEQITATSQVTVESTNGSLDITLIDTDPSNNNDTNITLIAKNAIVNKRNDDLAALKADKLSLSAGTGIKGEDSTDADGNPIVGVMNVEAETLEALSTAGDIVISDLSGDLTIGDVTPNISKPDLIGVEATAGSVAIDTTGALTVEQVVKAGGDISLTAKGGDITTSAAITATVDGNVSLDAANGISLGGSILATGGEVEVVANNGNITSSNTSTITADEDILVSAEGGSITLNAAVTSRDAGDIIIQTAEIAGTDVNTDININAAVTTENGYIKIDAADALSISGALKAQDTVPLDHDGILPVDGAVILSAGKGIELTANGSIEADAQVEITANDGSVYINDSITLTGAGDIIIEAKAATVADASVTINSNAPLTTKDGYIGITAANDVTIKAALDSNDSDGVDHNAMNPVDADDPIDGDIVIKAGGRIDTYEYGTLTADKSIVMDADGTISTDAAISAGTGITMDSETRNITIDYQSSTITPAFVKSTTGDIVLDAGTYIETNDAIDAEDGMVSMKAGSGIDINATVDAAKNIDMDAVTGLTTDAAILAGTGITMDATTGSITIDDDDTTSVGATVTATTGDIVMNAGVDITTNDAVDAEADSVTMTAANDVTINASVDGNDNVTIAATGGTIETTTLGDIEATTGDVTMTAGDNIDIDATVDALAQSVTMSAGDNIDINAAVEAKLKVDMDATAGYIDTTSLGSITAGTTVDMDAQTDIRTDAAILAGTGITMDATTGSITIDDDLTTNVGATVTATTGDIVMNAGVDITTNDAVDAEADSVTMTAANDVTINASVDGNDNVTIAATGGTIETTTLGDIEATTGDVIMTAGDNIDIDATVDALAQNVIMTAGDNIDINAAVEAKLKVDMDATAGYIDTTSLGSITAGTTVDMDARTDIRTDAAILAGTGITMDATTGSITIDDDLTTNVGATVTATTGDIVMNAGVDITTNDAVDAEADSVTMTAANDVTINASVDGNDNVTIAATGGTIETTTLGDIEATTGDVIMTAGDNIDIDATVDALAQNVIMTAGDNIDINAAVEAKLKVDMDATAGYIDTTSLGSITAGTTVDMDARTDIRTDAAILAGTGITMDATTGSITIDDDLTTSVGATVTATTGDIVMNAGVDITTNDAVDAEADNVTMTAANDVTINASVDGNDNVT
ncbi:MAG: filamentous hemagglutinin N-terminal domain-containing protein, partial [Akkermansia sp.]